MLLPSLSQGCLRPALTTGPLAPLPTILPAAPVWTMRCVSCVGLLLNIHTHHCRERALLNHTTAWVGRDLKAHPVPNKDQPPAVGRLPPTRSACHGAHPAWPYTPSGTEASTASLGSLLSVPYHPLSEKKKKKNSS